MKNLAIGTRLSLGFSLVLLLAAVIALSGVWRLRTLAQTSQQAMQAPLAAERYIADWSRTIHGSVRRTMAIARSADPALVAFFAEDTAATTREAAELQKKIEPLLQSAEARALWRQIQDARQVYLASRDATVKARADGNAEQAARLLKDAFMPATSQYLGLIQTLLVMQRRAIDASGEDIGAMYLSGRDFLLATGAAALLLGGVCAWLLTTGITRPLRRAVEVARTVAAGDLRSVIYVSGRDETAQLMAALREMNDSLVDIVRQVSRGVDVIATVSGEIAMGNRDLSARTESQAASMQQAAATVQALAVTVGRNHDSAQDASSLAGWAAEVARKGGAIVSGVVATMHSIKARSTRVADIISVIDGLAFQTNLLALNAAVEAAAAGEQGRGFAVVASEVRSLAQRSATAARDIKKLILNAVAEIEQGNAQVTDAGDTMQEIVSSVQQMETIMQGIMAGSAEQRTGMLQVREAMLQIDRDTQQNSALVGQAAAATAFMARQVEELAVLMAVFKLDSRIWDEDEEALDGDYLPLLG